MNISNRVFCVSRKRTFITARASPEESRKG